MRCVFAIACFGSLLACGDDSVVGSESLDAASPEAAAPDRCAGLAPLAVAAAPTRVRAGARVTLEATGGSGQYVFSLAAPGTGSGGAIDGSSWRSSRWGATRP